MIECGICFTEYQEAELELHRELCVLLLMLRCTICNVDFVSKEGLWNHLDLHEIPDESKELHYQEIKAKHKLHQCVLCNDQRAYSESFYWNHVHDVHDGFFLRCSDCGERFRSEKHKNDHASSNCKVSCQSVVSDFVDMEVDQVAIKAEHMASQCDEEVLKNKKLDSSFNSSASMEINQLPAEKFNSKRRMSATLNAVNDIVDCIIERNIADNSQQHDFNMSSTGSTATKCPHCDKEYATACLRSHIRTCHEPIECSICGITNYGTSRARNHKILKHMEPRYECAKCLEKFHIRAKYHRHSAACNADSGPLSSEMEHSPPVHLVNEEKGSENLLSHKPAYVEKNASPEASNTECSHCGIKESNVVNLVRHVLTHHEPVACDLCGITSPSLFQAQSHKEMVHKDLKNKCPHCSTHTWRGIQYRKHILRCKNLKSICEVCGKMLPNKRSFGHHKKICRDETVWNDRINCSKEREQKNIESSSSENLDLPQGKTSQVRDNTGCSAVVEKIPFPQEGLSESKCYYCNEDFPAPGYLKHHLKKYHELNKCDICGITILGISSQKFHKVVCHTEPKCVCPGCGLNFYDKRKYNQHWPHCNRKRNTCDVCGHKFLNSTTLRRHQKNKHPERIKLGKTSMSSQDDPKQSTRKPSSTILGAAVEGIANDCEEVCSSRQSSNNFEETELLIDSRSSKHDALSSVNDYHDTDSHMVDKETHCKVQVGSEKILQPHVENPSVQQYQRNICDDISTTVSHVRLIRVKSRHKMVQCHICGRTLRKDDLDVHIAICAKRKYSCDICSRTYEYRRDLNRHKNTLHLNTPSKKVIVASTDCTAEQKSNSVVVKDSDKSSEKNETHAESIELKMEITVEDTMLHEQEYLVPN